MAQEGFPWQASNRREDSVISEKVSFEVVQPDGQPRPLQALTNQHANGLTNNARPVTPTKTERGHGFHHGKRRFGSIKNPPVTRNNVKPIPAPEIQVIKASSRLPVRTIPRMYNISCSHNVY